MYMLIIICKKKDRFWKLQLRFHIVVYDKERVKKNILLKRYGLMYKIMKRCTCFKAFELVYILVFLLISQGTTIQLFFYLKEPGMTNHMFQLSNGVFIFFIPCLQQLPTLNNKVCNHIFPNFV